MGNEILIIVTSVLTALIVQIVAHRLARSRDKNADNKKFVALLNEAIANLSDPKNNQKDAYSILDDRFKSHHIIYLSILSIASPLTKLRLKWAWKIYFGDDGEQEWWLANEYSALLSNKLSNNFENTRLLAKARISCLVKLCS